MTRCVREVYRVMVEQTTHYTKQLQWEGKHYVIFYCFLKCLIYDINLEWPVLALVLRMSAQ